jgi:hypothetical protein
VGDDGHTVSRQSAARADSNRQFELPTRLAMSSTVIFIKKILVWKSFFKSLYFVFFQCWGGMIIFFQMALQAHSGPRPLIQLRYHFSHTVGLLGRGISRYLNTGQHKHRINAYIHQTAVPWVGFEPTIPASERAKTVHALENARLLWPASERAKTVHALDRAATVTGSERAKTVHALENARLLWSAGFYESTAKRDSILHKRNP